MADTDFFSLNDPYLGQVFGDEFTVEKLIGLGGMGTVYRAVQAVTERAVALKVLHRHLSSDVLVKRFQQEAQIISKLNHPNVVTVYKYGQHTDGALYIAMELAEGRTLTDLIQAEALFDPRRYVPLMIQIVDAVAYAHDLRIIHRDLKPENVMVVRSGRKERVKVLDFGIAKIVDTKYVITKTGMLCGSPPYMAPEQWSQARDLDGRVDIYALGVVFYAMVTGRLPFEADNTPGYMTLHLAGNPVPPIRRSETLHQVPALNDIILRCLKTARSDRFADAYELLDALKSIHLELQTGAAAEATSDTGDTADTSGASDKKDRPLSVPALPTPTDADYMAAQALGSASGETLAYGEDKPPFKPTRSRVDVLSRAATPGNSSDPTDPNGGGEGVPSLEWTRQTLINEHERARARKIHVFFVSAGAFMLLFLALSFVYFVWIDTPPDRSTPGAKAPPALNPSAPEKKLIPPP